MPAIEKTRAIVEAGETYDGKIIPTEKAEIDRPVRINEDATVKGSVYGDSITITEGTVEGSAMASSTVELENGEVDGELASDGQLTSDGSTVYGTVTGTRVRLTDTVVYGNVVATEAVIENSIVIGIVCTENTLVLDDSLAYTFKSRGETTLTDADIVLPQARVGTNITFETPVRVTGLGTLEVTGGEAPTLDESDLIDIDGTTYLSLAPRILNLEAVTDRLDELESGIKDVVTATSRKETPDPDEILDILDIDTGDD